MPPALPFPVFVPHSALEGEEKDFVTLTVDLPRVLESWRKSLFAFEWLDENGAPRALSALSDDRRTQREKVEIDIKAGKQVEQPVLGLGLLDCIEIGAGREVLLTLAALGYKTVPVHVPIQMEKDFARFRTDPPAPAKGKEAGNILFYVLIAVVLFAALGYAISDGMKGGSGAISAEQRRLMATEILRTADELKQAVARLRLRGCTETQISFENTAIAGYTNAGAPADKTCHVFDPAGAALAYVAPETSWLDSSLSASAGYGGWLFTGKSCVSFVGTGAEVPGCDVSIATTGDLLLVIPYVGEDLCKELNTRLGLDNPSNAPPTDSGSGIAVANKFTGSYAAPGLMVALPAPDQGRAAGCFETGAAPGQYAFYQVLIAR